MIDRLIVRVSPALAALALLAACGAAPSTSAAPEPTAVSASQAGCPSTGTTVAPPPEFPASFPLPPGTAVVSHEARSGGRVIVNAVVPSLDVKGVAEFFERELPRAGFTADDGESEPGEAESNYSGNGYRGRWKVNRIDGCDSAVTLQVLAGR